MKRIAFYTLGCRSNQYETEVIKQQFSTNWEIVEAFKEKADIIVINSCAVTHDAERKSRQTIRRALREAKEVFLTGCYSNLEKKEIKEIFPKIKILEKPEPRFLAPGSPAQRVRGNLMIEDGCENFCAYCIVPYARGRIKSKAPQQVIKEAGDLVSSGIKEIVLTGINLGAWEYSLPNLLKELSKIPGLLRIRLSSIEPMYTTKELIKTIAKTPKVCHHLHIPLQSGDNKILKLMGRAYSLSNYKKIIKDIRIEMPDCAITTDLIVGLPGEDDLAFKNTVKTIQQIRFSRLHVFPYSKRDGTKAAEMDHQIDARIIKKRLSILLDLNKKLIAEFRNIFIGKEVEILVEKQGEGLTSNFIRVKFKEPADLTGKLHKLKLAA